MQHQERVTVLGGNDSTQDQTPSGRSPIPVIVAAVGLISVFLVLLGGTRLRRRWTLRGCQRRWSPYPSRWRFRPLAGITRPGGTRHPGGIRHRVAAARPDRAGWQVANIDHGAGGWLAVSRGATTVAHTSTGGGLWSATTLQGLHGENPLAAVGESAIAVAVSGDGRSDASVARWSDLGRSWIVEQVEDGAWFAGMGTVGDEPYLVGSTGEEPDFHLHDVGVAAIWKHDGEDWSRIPLEAGPGSVVTSLVTGPDGLVAFGHTSTGPAAWGLDDGVATPVNLVLPDRSPGNTLTSVVFDGGTVVTGIGSESGATILFRGIDGHTVPKKLR